MEMKRLFTPLEASEMYGIPESELLLMAKSGKIYHYKFGRNTIRFSHKQISDYLCPPCLTEVLELKADEEIQQVDEEKIDEIILQKEIKQEEKQKRYEEEWNLARAYYKAEDLFEHLRKGRYKDKLQELHDRICVLSKSRKVIDKNEVKKLKEKYCLLIAAKFYGIKKYKEFHSPLSKFYGKARRIESTKNRTERILADYEIITTEDWIDICDQWGNKCLCCGKPGNYQTLTMDHVMPLVLAGAHRKHNIQPLCQSCNSRKGAKYIDYRIL